ncbi:hypothetical protein SS1G_12208 [Sclerotinia sclerotiorum 1980 UF-70]|uniref:Probable Xaa-Pro aminopeptidase P n=2 Tax=Sclerotinia sclerotiorum (strain ATCC 18683 / 1980 / Ss-1) TaxID=665079 RepID=A0A1D9Q3H3_SCLS1|nr:hypothetical protein SS1G_12208 [Sclerotinia sclerotiorum 1980 UF-70]APA09409.1 hypothetical protein sscle_05g041790 [Sclerotinia sclerotiorum 1980 UF-70]EDN96002.1 hypothetical protein SS1G_12208 [Sclerotinia sclerotiorum 1980 UF-70]
MTSEKDIREPLLPFGGPQSHPKWIQSEPRNKRRCCIDHMTFVLLLAVAIWIAMVINFFLPQTFHQDLQLTSPSLQKCAWTSLQHHTSLLDVKRIAREEFLERQSILALALEKAGVDAFIAEPSASTAYFTNISSSFELSERPFLVILDKKGHASLLVPKFEIGRITALDMVFEEKSVIEWREEESAYDVLVKETGYKKIMLDEHARFMIAAGLQANGVEVLPTSLDIQSLRAVKSEKELDILRGVNEFTVQLVRSLQTCISVGMSQETIVEAASGLFTQAGVGAGFWSIILFGEQAANPHGGGKGRVLQDGEFVLVDIGTSLHSYGSDVTRTILPVKSKVSKELMDMWHLVHDAQSAAIERMNINETCSAVDEAARKVITEKGYGEFFTHRLGHGLGLEMHEHPYLNGVNGEKLKMGEVVTNEPGIYITAAQAAKLHKPAGFGVRIEDAVLVTEKGGVVMTGLRARSPYEP